MRPPEGGDNSCGNRRAYVGNCFLACLKDPLTLTDVVIELLWIRLVRLGDRLMDRILRRSVGRAFLPSRIVRHDLVVQARARAA